MARPEPAVMWSLHYQLILSIVDEIGPAVAKLSLEPKELFVLSEIDEHPFPAALAGKLCMPKPTLTATLKRVEAAGFVRREIDAEDLRRHRLILTAAGRRAMVRGVAIISEAFGARLSRLSASELRTLQTLLEKLS
ncbi:MAG: MarR family winged helix-turn-helix transcriptional regulator [Gemmatimonadaceae bacterium]